MDERPDSSQQLMDILLVMDEKGTLQAVSGVKDGELQTKNPLEDNNDLLRVDRHGDMFSNFFSNLWSQLKDPTRFHFFRVPEEEVQRVAADFRQRESRSLRSTRCSHPCRHSSRAKPGSSNSRRVRRSSPPGRPNRTRSTSIVRRTSTGTASPHSACSGSRSRATGCLIRCYGASRPTRPSGCISTSTASRTATTASSRSSPARTAG